MADKPITRKEYFMAKAGGQDVKTPEPITREERFLDAIAKNGGGGGSGLPPISTEAEEILEEQSVSFSDVGGVYMGGVAGQFAINVGDTITVEWDGTSYECAVQDVMGFTTWGNLAIADMGDDTGEPFLMIYGSGECIEMYSASDVATHVCAISTESQTPPDGSILIAIGGEWQKAEGYGYEVEEGGVPTVHKIDNKYLPFLMINVDTNNQTIDCDYLTYKAAVEAGVPIWLCDTEHDEYYVLEGGELKVTNPTLTGSKWSYDSTQSAGHRLSASVLSVFMQVGSSGWSVTKVDYSTIEIPNV